MRNRTGSIDSRRRTLTRLLVVVLPAIALLAAVPALGLAAAPVVNEHENFTSDPYDDNWCGIEGIGVDRVVVHYKEDASGASLETVNITESFTATESGTTMEVRSTGARRSSAPIDNGDGTYSIIATNTGQSPGFKLPKGPPIVIDVGLVEFRLTFDSTTGRFVAFDVLRERGQHPPGCDLIVAALS